MTTPSTIVTWRDVAQIYPEFVQWAVQRHGGLPDGPITHTDYARLSNEYAEAVQAARESTA